VVTAAMNNQGEQKAHNATSDCNPSTNLKYSYGALYYKGRVSILANDELRKMIRAVEDDSKVTGHMSADKTMEIIKYNFSGQEWTSILNIIFVAVSLANVGKC
jgi:hypothetical protein